jgi:electron transfer flavoprotein beta subunit
VRFGFKKTRATVTVVNVGGPETEPTLRKALAIETIRVNATPMMVSS